MITAVICNFLGKDLKNDEIYQDRLAKGLITMRGEMQIEIKPYAKRSVAIFLIAIFSGHAFMPLQSVKQLV